MSANSSIEWTQQTWNPVRGCSRISPGCVNCYAERMAARGLPGHDSPTTGEPFAILTPSGPRWTGKVELVPHMLDVPLERRKPTTYFVNSMSDLFHEDLPDHAIGQVFGVMQLAKQHTFQILTKRACRLREWHQNNSPHTSGRVEFLPNVWIGVSVEDRTRKDRIDYLRETPAAVRFLSIEPLLEDIGELDLTGIDWVIIGGESGPGARPFDIAWARNVIAQCKSAGVPAFVKQLGAKPIDSEGGASPAPTENVVSMPLKDRKGGDMAEWPADLRVREFPEVMRG